MHGTGFMNVAKPKRFAEQKSMCCFTPHFSQTLLTVAPFLMCLMSSSFFATDKFTRLRFAGLLILLLILDKTQNFLAKSNKGYI